MTKYRISADWLEYSLNDGKNWNPVLCQRGLVNKENNLYACYRGCSAFEETDIPTSLMPYGETGKQVNLSCGCGRTIKLADA